MQLAFEHTINCGKGHAPQAVHDKTNRLRIIYLNDGQMVHCFEAIPTLGLYSDLSFTDYGRCSPDDAVSLPSIKRIAHYGAYGFWSSKDVNGLVMDHKFVIYMMPTDISKALVDGSVIFSSGSEVSSISCNLLNIRGELLNRYRALVTPGTKLSAYFSLGSSDETPLGVFYVDRSNVSYPEEKVSVSGRNAIGKLLKEQTFDENTSFNNGSLQDNIKAIMNLSEVEDFFVGDPGTDLPLTFDPDTTLLEGIKYAFSLLSNWKIAETIDGVVGISSADDARFDQPGTYTFVRDNTCWGYNIEYDDSDAASRVCVWCKITDESSEEEERRVYANVAFNKWWVQPSHRTLYVQTVDDATLPQITNVADTLASSLAASGRIETFVGLFTPQLTLGDEVRVIDENSDTEIVGSVTDVQHNFGKAGFYTSFTVDSGGRRGRTRLKDLITTAADYPEAFTGVSKKATAAINVTMQSNYVCDVESGTAITGTLNMAGGNMVIATVIHRSAIGATPEGWTLLHTTTGIDEISDYTQQISVYFKPSSSGVESVTFTQASAGRLYLNLLSLANAGIPYLAQKESSISSQKVQIGKGTSDAVVWAFHRVYWSTTAGAAVWKADGVPATDLVQLSAKQARLLNIFDCTDRKTISVYETGNLSNVIEFLAIGIPTTQ